MRLPLLIALLLPVDAAADCLYRAADGAYKNAPSREAVPEQHRSQAICSSASDSPPPEAAPPPARTAQGRLPVPPNHRRRVLSTDFGPLEVVWPRSVEAKFSDEIDQLIVEAFRAASRVSAQTGLPFKLKKSGYGWRVNVAERKRYPAASVGCHAGWMRPPADINVSVYDLLTGCGRRRPMKPRLASRRFVMLILHELGHALDFRLSEGGIKPHRWVREGMACWFAVMGSEHSSRTRGAAEEWKVAVRQAFQPGWKPTSFSGSFADYVRAYGLIRALTDAHSARQLPRTYRRMKTRREDFQTAVRAGVGWDPIRWQAQVKKSFGP